MSPEAVARLRAALAHAAEVARENHAEATGSAREWEAGRIAAYDHAAELLADEADR